MSFDIDIGQYIIDINGLCGQCDYFSLAHRERVNKALNDELNQIDKRYKPVIDISTVLFSISLWSIILWLIGIIVIGLMTKTLVISALIISLCCLVIIGKKRSNERSETLSYWNNDFYDYFGIDVTLGQNIKPIRLDSTDQTVNKVVNKAWVEPCHWLHYRGDGNKDLRYKHNPFIPIVYGIVVRTELGTYLVKTTVQMDWHVLCQVLMARGVPIEYVIHCPLY